MLHQHIIAWIFWAEINTCINTYQYMIRIDTCIDTYQYVLIRIDTYWYVLIRIDTYWYVLICIDTCIDTYWYVLICIDTYWYVFILFDTYWYVLIHVLISAQNIHASMCWCNMHVYQFLWVWSLQFRKYRYLQKWTNFPFDPRTIIHGHQKIQLLRISPKKSCK